MNPENKCMGQIPLSNEFSVEKCCVLAQTTLGDLQRLHAQIRSGGCNLYTISDLCNERYDLPTIIIEMNQLCEDKTIRNYMLDLSIDEVHHQLDILRNDAETSRQQAESIRNLMQLENDYFLKEFRELARATLPPLIADQQIAKLEGYSAAIRNYDPSAPQIANYNHNNQPIPSMDYQPPPHPDYQAPSSSDMESSPMSDYGQPTQPGVSYPDVQPYGNNPNPTIGMGHYVQPVPMATPTSRFRTLAVPAGPKKPPRPVDDVAELFQTLGITESPDAGWKRRQKEEEKRKKLERQKKACCVVS